MTENRAEHLRIRRLAGIVLAISPLWGAAQGIEAWFQPVFAAAGYSDGARSLRLSRKDDAVSSQPGAERLHGLYTILRSEW